MSNKLPVVAAIPNYNMAAPLAQLLPEVLEQEYAAVYVLDDASTDHSRDVVEEFGNDVQFIAGTENKGSGGNRNRIMKALRADSLIHFLDADVRLKSPDVVTNIHEIMGDPYVGIAGGLVTDETDRQSIWNYGPRQCLHTDITAVLHLSLDQHPGANRLFRRKLGSLLADWPDVSVEPTRRETYWVHEANLIVRSAKFTQLGGFYEKIRYHDIQDLAIRTQRDGLRTIFDPAIRTMQTNEVNVRGGDRHREELKAELKIALHNGWRDWLFPDGRFKPTYNDLDD